MKWRAKQCKLKHLGLKIKVIKANILKYLLNLDSKILLFCLEEEVPGKEPPQWALDYP